MRVDATLCSVEAALRGYMKWLSALGQRPQQDDSERRNLEGILETWGTQLIGLRFEVLSICFLLCQTSATDCS